MGLLNDILNENDVISKVKNDIKEEYLSDLRPWVIGYSGGKDSTTVMQLVIECLLDLKTKGYELKKDVYIISSDTMVETPLIISSIGNNLNKIQEFAIEKELPVKTQLVRPQIDNTFWVNVIGKGYPVPNQSFRWCTDRMKIDPTNRFIKETVSKYGEVIVLLGVRQGESVSRDRVLEHHNIEGKRIMRHTTLSNAYTFAPIKCFTVDDVWNYLLKHDSPWGDDNAKLFKLYSESNSGECPLIIDSETKNTAGSCGNGRFGCWICTVVNEDKALTGFVRSGEEWLRPLLQYRNWLSKNRDNRSMRMKMRANGTIYTIKVNEKNMNGEKVLVIPKKSGRDKVEITVQGDNLMSTNDETFDVVHKNKLSSYLKTNKVDLTAGEIPNLLIKEDDDSYSMLGLGPYTFTARKEMLENLLKIQKDYQDEGRNITLITDEEIKEIRIQWLKRGMIEDILPKMYFSIFGRDLNWKDNDIQLISNEQYEHLKKICEEEDLYINPILEMFKYEQKKSRTRFKKSDSTKIHDILIKDYLHY